VPCGEGAGTPGTIGAEAGKAIIANHAAVALAAAAQPICCR
jgi:hypothetical protein